MTVERKIRLQQRLKPIIFFTALGVLYYIWLKATGIGIPCIFKTVTGYSCPGCGITRMLEAVLRLDFKAAYKYNGAVLILLPILGAVYGFETVRYIKDGKTKYTLVSKLVMAVACVILLTFGVVRNI